MANQINQATWESVAGAPFGCKWLARCRHSPVGHIAPKADNRLVTVNQCAVPIRQYLCRCSCSRRYGSDLERQKFHVILFIRPRRKSTFVSDDSVFQTSDCANLAALAVVTGGQPLRADHLLPARARPAHRVRLPEVDGDVSRLVGAHNGSRYDVEEHRSISIYCAGTMRTERCSTSSATRRRTRVVRASRRRPDWTSVVSCLIRDALR